MLHMTTDDESFWQFALHRYARSGVAPLCLQLQDELQADVLLLLCLAWRADHGHALPQGELERLVHRSSALRHNLIEPLRAARRSLGAAARATGLDSLQTAAQALAAAELRCERLQARYLASAALPEPGTAASASASTESLIQRYLVHIGTEPGIARQRAWRLSALMGAPGAHRPA